MLFRTEEVIDRSPTSPLHKDCGRLLVDDFSIPEFDGYLFSAVGAGVFDANGLTWREAFVADQQQEVNRSPYVEFVYALPNDRMIVVP